MNESIAEMSKEQLAQRLGDDHLTVIDLRLNWDECTEKIKQAVHEDPRETATWAVKYDRHQPIVLYCSSPDDKVSRDVTRSLLERGFTDLCILKGGWFVWQAARLPVERKTKEPLPGKLIKGVISD
ncbi:MAG: rhodanese-like domain-containing protein [Desulfobacterales bacterium]